MTLFIILDFFHSQGCKFAMPPHNHVCFFQTNIVRLNFILSVVCACNQFPQKLFPYLAYFHINLMYSGC